MRRKPRGFTLVELAVVLAVVAVLALVAVPAFSRLLMSARTATAFHGLTAAMAMARIHAVSHEVPTTVCPSLDGEHCRRDLVWETGWIVFQDPRSKGVPATSGAILQRLSPSLAGLAIRSTVGRHYVRFRPDGFSYGTNFTLRICTRKPLQKVGDVVVNNAGRVRSQRPAKPLACPYAP